MPVQADETYDATCVEGYMVESSTNETPGLYINYRTAEGPISKVWYVTPGTADRFAEMMLKCFNIGTDKLADDEFMFGGAISKAVKDQPVSIVTEAEEYKGRMRVVVKWMNAPRSGKKMRRESAGRVTGLFGGSVSAPRTGGNAPDGPPPTEWPTSEDVPF